eukprot:7422939-Alexandrium_andersonii.AAC.1
MLLVGMLMVKTRTKMKMHTKMTRTRNHNTYNNEHAHESTLTHMNAIAENYSTTDDIGDAHGYDDDD